MKTTAPIEEKPLPLKPPPLPVIPQEKWVRLIAFAMAATSFGFAVVAMAYGIEIGKLPADRFQGGHGFALNGPFMMYGAGCLFFALLGTLHFVTVVGFRWRRLLLFPNFLTAFMLLPGVYGILRTAYIIAKDSWMAK